jgi:hypothetical protein
MNGLESKIRNIENRKRHIMENMLYMSEINKKNVYVCRQIFGCKYNLNLYCGDSLSLDTEEEWGCITI